MISWCAAECPNTREAIAMTKMTRGAIDSIVEKDRAAPSLGAPCSFQAQNVCFTVNQRSFNIPRARSFVGSSLLQKKRVVQHEASPTRPGVFCCRFPKL